MGYTAKKAPGGLYGKLLVLYPAPYRKRYGQPMVQTFSDMLDDQPSRLGKTIIWTKALMDLPVSAMKEHLTNGKVIPMNRNTKLFLGGIILILLLGNGVSWWYGNLHSRQTSGVEKVSVSQLAGAMQDDSFYSTYGNTALLFSGKVSSVQTQGQVALVSFQTNRPYSLSCQFPNTSQIAKGQTISVAAPGGSAERQQNGVLLHDCVEN